MAVQKPPGAVKDQVNGIQFNIGGTNYYTPTYNVNAGGGILGLGGFELTIINYTGNPREIHSRMITVVLMG